jgi:hypothetical protein
MSALTNEEQDEEENEESEDKPSRILPGSRAAAPKPAKRES